MSWERRRSPTKKCSGVRFGGPAPRRADTRFDSELEVKPQAKKEKHFAEDEKRADRQADQVIDKRRLAALPGMADELDNPADHEGADADQQPVARRQPRSPIAEGQRRQQQKGHDRAEDQIELQVISGGGRSDQQ